MRPGARALNRWAAPLRSDRTGRKLERELARLPPKVAARIRRAARHAQKSNGLLLLPSNRAYRDAALELIAEHLNGY